MARMRNYAIKQALSELGDNPSMAKIEFVAKRHLLSYAELKQAYNKEKKNDRS